MEVVEGRLMIRIDDRADPTFWIEVMADFELSAQLADQHMDFRDEERRLFSDPPMPQ